MNTKFYICKHCGNLIGMIEDKNVPISCCGEKMTALIPNTVDASNEKHLPIVSVEGCKVTINIGAVSHPMTEEHYIKWVYVQTEKGGRRHTFTPDEKAVVTLCVDGDKPIAVYAYCNLHGLWKTDIQ